MSIGIIYVILQSSISSFTGSLFCSDIFLQRSISSLSSIFLIINTSTKSIICIGTVCNFLVNTAIQTSIFLGSCSFFCIQGILKSLICSLAFCNFCIDTNSQCSISSSSCSFFCIQGILKSLICSHSFFPFGSQVCSILVDFTFQPNVFCLTSSNLSFK